METQVRAYIRAHALFFSKWWIEHSSLLKETFRCANQLDIILNAECESEADIKKDLKDKSFSFEDCVVAKWDQFVGCAFVVARSKSQKGISVPSFYDDPIFKTYRDFIDKTSMQLAKKFPEDGILYGPNFWCSITPSILCYAISKLKLKSLYAIRDEYASELHPKNTFEVFNEQCKHDYNLTVNSHKKTLQRCKDDPKCTSGKNYYVLWQGNPNDKRYQDYRFWNTFNCSSKQKFFDSFRLYKKSLTDEKILEMVKTYLSFEIAKHNRYESLKALEKCIPMPNDWLEKR